MSGSSEKRAMELQESETVIHRDGFQTENQENGHTEAIMTSQTEEDDAEDADNLYRDCGAPKPSHFHQQLQMPQHHSWRKAEPLLHPRYRRGMTRSNQSSGTTVEPSNSATGRAASGIPYDPFGPFAMKEGPAEQMERIKELQRTCPSYCKAIMEQGDYLIELATHGKVGEISKIVNMSRETELLHYFNSRMFIAASKNAQIKTMLYMVSKGLNVDMPLLKTVMHDVIRTMEDDKKLCLVIRSLAKLGFNADEPVRVSTILILTELQPVDTTCMVQDPDSSMTPLHVACSMGQLEASRVLVDTLKADVNSVAMADRMPLTLAEDAVRRVKTLLDDATSSKTPEDAPEPNTECTSGMSHGTTQSEASFSAEDIRAMENMFEKCKELVHFLESRGAQRTWRTTAPTEVASLGNSVAAMNLQQHESVTEDADGGQTMSAQDE